MLTIGIDARLIDGKGGGTKVYTELLVSNLLKIDRENFYYLYAYKHHPNLSKIAEGKDNVKIHSAGNKFIWRTPMIYNTILKDRLHVFHFPAYNVAPAIIKPEKPKIVVTFHGLDAIFFKKRERPLIWKMNYKISAKVSDKIISVSNKLKEELIKVYNLKENKIATIYYGIPKPNIDTSKLPIIKEKYGIDDHDIILCVDGAEKRKNITTLIKSIRLIKNMSKLNFKLIITRSKYYKEIINALNLEEDIKLYEWIPHDELNFLYYLSKIIVYPSLYEGVGFPVIEAIQHGKPVLISGNTAMAELIEEPFLIVQEPLNEQEWASRIITLLEDKSMYSKMESYVRKQSERFSIEKMVKAHLELYKELAED